MDLKLGRIEGPLRKKDGEASKKQTAGVFRKDFSGNSTSRAIFVGLQVPQAYSPAPPTIIQPQPPQQYAPTQVQQSRAPALRPPQPAQRISFNEVKPPNVHANPLPDHGSSSGPSINMISIAAIGEEEDLQENLVPFIIDYAPVEVLIASAPFVIEVLAKEPYHDCRVPWNYGDEVANMEQEMSATHDRFIKVQSLQTKRRLLLLHFQSFQKPCYFLQRRSVSKKLKLS
ncbi:hypothetical protein CRG98_007617 [Punica granatum]|uniref:Uncharacterized protein n=1 Tax=Punica granatum TaxID=22663 RepID=A0A2I0KU56_PUNGR|nr:hypothetical protein CRG98_007617 [Punica granatum]